MLKGPELGAAIEAARLKKGVTKKALADALGVKPPSIQDLVKRGTIDKGRLPLLWAFFSGVVGPEHWGMERWMNDQHSPTGATRLVAQEVSHPTFYPERTSINLRVPVTGTLQMSESGVLHLTSPAAGASAGTVESYSSSPGSYALRIIGDSLYPTVRHGACIIIEPGAKCVEGELVLLVMQNGTLQLQELVAQRPDFLTVLPVNGGHRATIPTKTVREMHPVTNIVAASKYRPSTATSAST